MRGLMWQRARTICRTRRCFRRSRAWERCVRDEVPIQTLLVLTFHSEARSHILNQQRRRHGSRWLFGRGVRLLGSSLRHRLGLLVSPARR